MVLGSEFKQCLIHVAKKLEAQAKKIRGGEGKSFELHSSTAVDRESGSTFHCAYTLIVTEDEKLVRDFIDNYQAWMKVKGIGKRIQ